MDWIELLLFSLGFAFRAKEEREKQKKRQEAAIAEGPAAVAALNATVDRQTLLRDPRVRSGRNLALAGLLALVPWVAAVYAVTGQGPGVPHWLQVVEVGAVLGLPVASIVLIMLGMRRIRKAMAVLHAAAVASAVAAVEHGTTSLP